jgi:hypothetical protein
MSQYMGNIAPRTGPVQGDSVKIYLIDLKNQIDKLAYILQNTEERNNFLPIWLTRLTGSTVCYRRRPRPYGLQSSHIVTD